MRPRCVISVALATGMLVPDVARAAPRLGLGADYVFSELGIFALTLALEGRLARRVAAQVRLGALIATPGPAAGVPLDIGVRFTPRGGAYFEALAGPWFFFSNDAVRGHGGFGFGIGGRDVSFGVEVGVLTTGNGMIGARLSFPL